MTRGGEAAEAVQIAFRTSVSATSNEQRNELNADQDSFDALADIEKKLQLLVLALLSFIRVSNFGLVWRLDGSREQRFLEAKLDLLFPSILKPGTTIVFSAKDWINRHGALSNEDQTTIEDIVEKTGEDWPSLRRRGNEALDLLLQAVFKLPRLLHPIEAVNSAGNILMALK